jgi:hypothetical protein
VTSVTSYKKTTPNELRTEAMILLARNIAEMLLNIEVRKKFFEKTPN